jgi:hypothetical protein
MWKHSRHTGAMIPFATITAADDYLHPIAPDAHFTSIETNLYGFNIPRQDIQCNIYVLWHPVLRTMSIHILVYRGARILPHQLAADYFHEQVYLPAVAAIDDWRAQMGSCEVALQLTCKAAMPPVGRPGGRHFTQLMKTRGALTLDGARYAIDGYYMRDRSWGYLRPEEPERTPPYRWITGWFGDDCAFVLAWIDTGMLDEVDFGPAWSAAGADSVAAGLNKWESGGPTPSLTLRSGWFAVNGKPRPVVKLDVRTLFSGASRLLVKAIELVIEDADGGVHRVTGETTSMIPKMYWQNLLTYMHSVRLTCGERSGHGDLMDTYSNHHIRSVGV